jgi:hypothetical protein
MDGLSTHADELENKVIRSESSKIELHRITTIIALATAVFAGLP